MIANSAVAAVSDRRRRSEIDATIYVAQSSIGDRRYNLCRPVVDRRSTLQFMSPGRRSEIDATIYVARSSIGDRRYNLCRPVVDRRSTLQFMSPGIRSQIQDFRSMPEIPDQGRTKRGRLGCPSSRAFDSQGRASGEGLCTSLAPNPSALVPVNLIPATTDSPTRFPLQYHGPWRA